MSDAALTVRELAVDLGGRPLVEHVGFELAPGERVGLIGESGSGKSLTALAIMGLLPDELRATRQRGARRHRARRPSRAQLAPLRGERISMVFQEPMTALDPMMRVGSQVAEIVRVHRDVARDEALARAAELFALVGLPAPRERLRAYPHQLSGGAAPARADRNGARLRPVRADRRRADHRARRHRAGSDPRAAAPARRRSRHRAPADHTRPARDRVDLRTRAGDAGRAHHRARADARGVRVRARAAHPSDARGHTGADRRARERRALTPTRDGVDHHRGARAHARPTRCRARRSARRRRACTRCAASTSRWRAASASASWASRARARPRSPACSWRSTSPRRVRCASRGSR